MFSFFRRRKEADTTARRIIDKGCFLGARTPREAVEMSWGRPLSENEWVRYASVWERIWRESLKERPIESRPPHQLRLAISTVTDELQPRVCIQFRPEALVMSSFFLPFVHTLTHIYP